MRSQAAGIVVNVYRYFKKIDRKLKRSYSTSITALKQTSLANGKLLYDENECMKKVAK